MDPTYVIVTVEGTEVAIPQELGHWHELMPSGLPSFELKIPINDRTTTEHWLWLESASCLWGHPEPLFARQTTMDSALRDLMDLASLEEDWDGMGAAAPTHDILGRALRLLPAVALVPPEVSAHPAGTVLFEWESEAGRAYIEIGRTVFNFYMATRYQQPYAEVGSVDSLEAGEGCRMPTVLQLLQSQRELLAPPRMIGMLHVEL